MVRGVALQTNPSGSYYDPSQGIFASAVVSANTPPPINVSVSRTANGIKLTWNTQLGIAYRVLGKTNFSQPNWTSLSGGIIASSPTTSWTDNNLAGVPARFYRITSP
jgi:hypothetical protein